ncbi:MAG TPA: Asp-tRNA(Asn)/Glu-tRNA(Gln) amidotransferase subunit GatA [Phycisphaerales bacterium]|nr:Asp-tRNA(Asn)/Glu-tRNA(Gln) amidotransferase subunit GatA [Phycisphaerales bacterium]HMP37990.1 Asp-tRNA(Asn)/Glu-tRNA(Gln) amidotransferase subunit GatA [Phycisphaerales bacterium]
MSAIAPLLRDVTALRAAIAERRVGVLEVVDHCIDVIGRRDGELRALREVYPERARRRADAIDAALAGRRDDPSAAGLLAGVPVVVKDNIVTDYGTTTCGSRMLDGYASPYSATVIERLEEAGAIVLGKANCDEFAMGSSTESCAFGATRNPWDLSRVPGGSSGGSAVAIAAGYAALALGSETGGSVRQPAALCGVVGIKPSYGRVSRYGLVAFGSSLDQVGPFAHSVGGAAMLLQVIAGRDERDSTSADLGVPDYLQALDDRVESLVVGVPVQYRSDANDPRVAQAIEQAVEVYRGLGAEIVEIDLPLTDYGISTYYVIAPAEASSNLARFDGIRYGHRAVPEPGEVLEDLYARSRAEGFGPEVQRRIMLGTYMLSAGYYEAYYRRALQVRRLIAQEYARAFERCHVLLGPTAPTPAFPLGGKADPLSMYLCDVYTVNTNIAGACAISIPCGLADEGGRRLPIGLHLQARPFDESVLLRAARMFERATDWSELVVAPSA